MSCKAVRKIIFGEAIAPCCAYFVCIAGSDVGRQGCWKAWHNSFPGASLVEASTNLGVNRLRDWPPYLRCLSYVLKIAPVMTHVSWEFLPRASLGMGSTFTNSDLNDFGQVAEEEITIECGNSKVHQRCACVRTPY